MRRRSISRVAILVMTFSAAMAEARDDPQLSNVYLDHPLPAARETTLVTHSICDERGKCVVTQDLKLVCQNGQPVTASIVQPIGEQATVSNASIDGRPTTVGGLAKINLLLSKKPKDARVDVEGYCASDSASVIFTAYAAPKIRSQAGDDIIVSPASGDSDNLIFTNRLDGSNH
jgi:hypothetical protein